MRHPISFLAALSARDILYVILPSPRRSQGCILYVSRKLLVRPNYRYPRTIPSSSRSSSSNRDSSGSEDDCSVKWSPCLYVAISPLIIITAGEKKAAFLRLAARRPSHIRLSPACYRRHVSSRGRPNGGVLNDVKLDPHEIGSEHKNCRNTYLGLVYNQSRDGIVYRAVKKLTNHGRVFFSYSTDCQFLTAWHTTMSPEWL